jgi:WD40 repeat protein
MRSLLAVLACLAISTPTLGQSRVDSLGDPLPEGAIARVGTTRMRHFSLPDKLCFGIGCIAWSPDGKTIASTSFASGRVGVEARLWEASTGKPLCRLDNNQTYGPSFVRFSPDSKTLAAAAGSKLVLWDVTTGKEIGQLVGHSSQVDSLVFQDGGKVIVSVGEDGAVHWWDVASRKAIRVWQTLANEAIRSDKGDPFEMRIFNACFSNDGKSLAFEKWWTADKGFRRSGNTMALVFDVDARKELWREDTDAYGCSFAFAPNGKRLAMAGKRHQFFLCDVATGRHLKAGPSISFAPYGLAFAPDGKSVAIHWFAGLAFWSLDDKTPLRDIGLRGDSTGPTFSPDGKHLAVSAGVSTYISFCVLDVATGKRAVYWPSNDGSWTRLQFTADGRTLLRVNGGSLAGIDTASWTVKWEVEDPPKKVRFHLPKVANVPNFDKIMQLWADDPNFRGANADHSLCVAKNGEHPNALLDLKTGKVRAQLDRPEAGLDRCSGFFSPRSTLYIMCDSDSQGRKEINTIFAIPSGKRLCRLPSENSKLAWSFSADESRVASFDWKSGIIRVHDTATGKLIRQIGQANPEWKWIWATLALSPDGNMLAVWTEGLRNVQIWDLRTGKHHRWLALQQIDKGHAAACLAWSPDNRILAVGGLDNSIRLWDVASAQVRHAFVGHIRQARVLAFSPNGQVLASGNDDTTLLIWKTLADKNRD